MPAYSEQLLVKLTEQDIADIDSGHHFYKDKFGTRSDYVRYCIRTQVERDLQKFRATPNEYVKDVVLNKVIWTILSSHHLSTLPLPDGRPFRALYLDDFVSPLREYIEDIFRDLKKSGCLDYERNHAGRVVAFGFDISKLVVVAKDNLNMDIMQPFINGIKKWNTPQGVSVDDICHSAFHSTKPLKVKDDLSNNGFIILKDSRTHIPNNWFVRDVINNGPSEYARLLWDLEFYRGNDKPSNLYVTFPDIYMGE